MILPDNPITNKKEDRLRRTLLSEKIAALINTYDSTESFVIGIEGGWGSGKTSLVNLILKNLDTNITNFEFNPWNFSSENSLIMDFFSNFVDRIDAEGKGKTKVRKALDKYAGKISGIGFMSGSVSFHEESLDQTLQQVRKELDAILKKSKQKILVVVDDIDRLNSGDTRLIFKLVKLLANFPNTIFLLSYARDKVEKRLNDENFEGAEYLKKIIQVSFTLPVPDEQDLYEILNKDINETLVNVYGNDDIDNSRWSTLSFKGYYKFFSTIRDIKRYISSLRLNWSIIGKDDVNKLDFIVIEAIRVFAPNFYNAIAANKHLFTNTTSMFDGLSLHLESKARKEKYEELLKLVAPEIRDAVDKLCKDLFPKLDQDNIYESESWERDLRVCSNDRFNYYFQLGIPTGAVSGFEIDNLFATAPSKEYFLSNIRRYYKENKIGVILRKFQLHTDKVYEKDVLNIVTSFWNLWDETAEERRDMWTDYERQSVFLGHALISEKIPKNKRKKIVLNLLEYETLYYPVLLVAYIEKEIRDNHITAEELESLKLLAGQKIKSSLRGNKILEHKATFFLLLKLRDWGEKDDVKEYIHKVIQNKESLIKLLLSFTGLTLSTAGNYMNINKNGLAELYPIEEIEKEVNKIKIGKKTKLEAREIESIKLFKNPKD